METIKTNGIDISVDEREGLISGLVNEHDTRGDVLSDLVLITSEQSPKIEPEIKEVNEPNLPEIDNNIRNSPRR